MERKQNQQKNFNPTLTPSFNRLHEIIIIREEQQRRLQTSILHHQSLIAGVGNPGTIGVTPYLYHYPFYLPDNCRPHLLPVFRHQQAQVINHHSGIHFTLPQTPYPHPRFNGTVIYDVNNASNTPAPRNNINQQQPQTPISEIALNPPPPGTTPIFLPSIENDISRLLKDYRCIDAVVEPLPPRFCPAYPPPSPFQLPPYHHHRVNHPAAVEHHQTLNIANECADSHLQSQQH